MTGMCFNWGAPLISASTSRPSVPGRLRSSRMTPGRGASAKRPRRKRSSSASSPSAQRMIGFLSPDLRKARSVVSKSSGLSSTRRIGWLGLSGTHVSFLQGEIEGRPLAGGRLDPDSAMVALDDLLDDRRARAGAAAVLVAAVQALEDAEHGVAVLFRDADAVVAHVEERRPVRALPPADLDPLLRLVVVLHGVDDQVLEDLADADAVGAHRGQRPGDAHLDLLLAQRDGQRVEDLGHDLVEVDAVDGEVDAAQPGVLEERVDQRLHAAGTPHQGLQLGPPTAVELAAVILQQEAGEVVDLSQRLLEVVGGDVGEGIELLVALIELLVALLELPGALLDPLLQHVLGPLQLGVAALDLVEHAVEGVDQLAELVVGPPGGAERIVAALGDRPRRPREIEDRP